MLIFPRFRPLLAHYFSISSSRSILSFLRDSQSTTLYIKYLKMKNYRLLLRSSYSFEIENTINDFALYILQLHN